MLVENPPEVTEKSRGSPKEGYIDHEGRDPVQNHKEGRHDSRAHL